MADPIRLSRHLAAMLPCSRREAELYIAGGWVRVDGVVVEEPQFRITDQKVELDLGGQAEPALPASMLWYKPAGLGADAPAFPASPLIQPGSRAADDASGVRLLRRHFTHLESVVPIDAAASGLVVLTQDRHLARKLKDDFARFEQEYVVEISGDMPADGLAQLQRGAGIQPYGPAAIKASWQSEKRLRIAAKAIRPGQVRQMCEAVGLQVVAMRRIRVGRLPMARLAVGEWRYLAPDERF